MANKNASLGLQIKRGNGANPEVFTALAAVDNISGPGLSMSPIDVTTLDDTWDEFVAGIRSGGDFTMTLQFEPDDTGHQALLGDFTAGTLRNFELVFPNTGNTLWAFSAYVTKYAPKGAVKSALTADVSLKISGQPTLVTD